MFIAVHSGVRPPQRSDRHGSLRASLGIPADARVVDALARLQLPKHLYWLIGATAKLHMPTHCVIAGEGEQRAELEDLAQRRGDTDRVHLVGFDEGEIATAVVALRTDPSVPVTFLERAGSWGGRTSILTRCSPRP